MVPVWRGAVFRGIHGVKPIIIDKMILGGNATCLKLSDQTNVVSMNWGHTNILSTARPGLPLWDLATSRGEAGLQDIDRASPGMGQAKGSAVTLGSAEELNGGNATDCTLWCLVDVVADQSRRRHDAIVAVNRSVGESL
jgi:hypothetical protein